MFKRTDTAHTQIYLHNIIHIRSEKNVFFWPTAFMILKFLVSLISCNYYSCNMKLRFVSRFQEWWPIQKDPWTTWNHWWWLWSSRNHFSQVGQCRGGCTIWLSSLHVIMIPEFTIFFSRNFLCSVFLQGRSFLFRS